MKYFVNKRHIRKKRITLDMFKDRFSRFIQQSSTKTGVMYDEYDRIITYSKMVKLSQEERKSFNEIMGKIQKSGCVHYTIPKKIIGRSSVHTVPNRIG